MLGPASFVNHESNPNAWCFSGEKKTISIQTVRTDEVEEEVSVFYSPDYFGEFNRNCECNICRREVEDEPLPSEQAFVEEVLPSEDVVVAEVLASEQAVVEEELPSEQAVEEVLPSEDVVVDVLASEQAVVEKVLHSEAIVELPSKDVVVEEVLASEQAVIEEVFPSEGVAESCQEVLCDYASRDRFQLQRPQKFKRDPILEYLVCHAVIKRMEKHLSQHIDILEKSEIIFINDFYRTKNFEKLQNLRLYGLLPTICISGNAQIHKQVLLLFNYESAESGKKSVGNKFILLGDHSFWQNEIIS